MYKDKLKYTMALLLFAVISCTKENTVQEQLPVTIVATTNATKAVVSDFVLPDTYTIYASAYYTNQTIPDEKGNYFIAAPFRYNGSTWSADPVRYWPIGGKLDMLSIACESESLDIASRATWKEDNCTEGVEITLNDGDCLNSEILFASTRNRTSRDGSILMQFNHSQDWLHFSVSTNVETIRIDSIKVRNVYTGGTLRVDNRSYLDAEWSFRGHSKVSRIVSGSKGLIPSAGTPATCDMLVPEQDACDIDIYYSMKSTPTDDWSTAVSSVYHYGADVTPWRYGEKHVFNIVFTAHEISLTTTVSEWDAVTEDIDVNDEEED